MATIKKSQRDLDVDNSVELQRAAFLWGVSVEKILEGVAAVGTNRLKLQHHLGGIHDPRRFKRSRMR